MAQDLRLPRALTPHDLFLKSYRTLAFVGDWERAFGSPDRQGVWILWGGSGSGKTSFALQLARELTRFGRVAYNSLEQGASLTMRQALERHDLGSVRRGSFLLLSEDLETLSLRLERKRSPDFVIIDSLQYTGMDYRSYKAFKARHPNKLLIFVSHADGIKPEGRTASKVMYDAEMKIFVEGYRAISKGRFVSETGAFYTIWREGAVKYWLQGEAD